MSQVGSRSVVRLRGYGVHGLDRHLLAGRKHSPSTLR